MANSEIWTSDSDWDECDRDDVETNSDYPHVNSGTVELLLGLKYDEDFDDGSALGFHKILGSFSTPSSHPFSEPKSLKVNKGGDSQGWVALGYSGVYDLQMYSNQPWRATITNIENTADDIWIYFIDEWSKTQAAIHFEKVGSIWEVRFNGLKYAEIDNSDLPITLKVEFYISSTPYEVSFWMDDVLEADHVEILDPAPGGYIARIDVETFSTTIGGINSDDWKIGGYTEQGLLTSEWRDLGALANFYDLKTICDLSGGDVEIAVRVQTSLDGITVDSQTDWYNIADGSDTQNIYYQTSNSSYVRFHARFTRGSDTEITPILEEVEITWHEVMKLEEEISVEDNPISPSYLTFVEPLVLSDMFGIVRIVLPESFQILDEFKKKNFLQLEESFSIEDVIHRHDKMNLIEEFSVADLLSGKGIIVYESFSLDDTEFTRRLRWAESNDVPVEIFGYLALDPNEFKLLAERNGLKGEFWSSELEQEWYIFLKIKRRRYYAESKLVIQSDDALGFVSYDFPFSVGSFVRLPEGEFRISGIEEILANNKVYAKRLFLKRTTEPNFEEALRIYDQITAVLSTDTGWTKKVF